MSDILFVWFIYCLSGHPPPPEALSLLWSGVPSVLSTTRLSTCPEAEGTQSLRTFPCNKYSEAWAYGPPRCLRGREPACQCRSCGLDPWVRKSPWRKKWQPTLYSCLESSIDGAAWRAPVPGVTESRTWLSRAQAKRTYAWNRQHSRQAV